MTRKEELTKMYKERMGKYYEAHWEFFTNPSIGRVEPFKIADNLYYVGDKYVCIHLIDAGEGLILLDSGYLGTTHLLIDSIWRLGFDPANVRWIIHTHGHSDHFGASDEFKSMFGTKLAISKAEADAFREKPHRSHVNKELYPFAKMPVFDYEIEDGEIFEYGNVKIRFVLTPGHTVGVISPFFEVTDNGKTYLAGMYGGAGVNAVTLANICYNEAPEDSAQQMLASIEKVWNEPVTVHIGNHPYNNKTMEKRQKQLIDGGNPFIAPESWHEFLGGLRTRIETIIKDNEELEKELSEKYGE